MHNFSNNSVLDDFISEYKKKIDLGFKSIDALELDKILSIITHTRKNGYSIYAGGNGGSSAISDHLCCDWLKGAPRSSSKPLRVHSLTSNSSLMTAISNDYAYSESLSKQLEYFLTSDDLVVLISSSGNSPNIIQAAKYTKKIGAKLVGLCGFSGGELKNLADYSIYIPIHNYGIVEDVHQSIMHIISQYLLEHQ